MIYIIIVVRLAVDPQGIKLARQLNLDPQTGNRSAHCDYTQETPTTTGDRALTSPLGPAEISHTLHDFCNFTCEKFS